VRYRADGNLEFLGRIDHQVKVRGFRIELGEIEAVLQSHPSVRETALNVHSVAPGDERLVAYVVPRDPERAPSGSDLRTHLKAHLPTYMLPAAFVMLEQLPLTPAGKVDRRALPAPEPAQADSGVPYEAPTTELQEQLVELFTEFLGAQRVGIHDDFFELGGHSLLATQLVSQLRERFQLELPLRSFFEAPTVAELAEQIADARGVDGAGLDKIDHALAALEALSADEVKTLLEQRRTSVGSDRDET
jgi:acyl carrier protein